MFCHKGYRFVNVTLINNFPLHKPKCVVYILVNIIIIINIKDWAL